MTVRAEGALGQEVGEGRGGRHGDRIRGHDATDRDTAEHAPQLGLAGLRGRRADEEPANQRGPQAGQIRPEPYRREPGQHHEPAQRPARCRRSASGSQPVAGAMPQICPQQSSPVERGGRQRVEDGQQDVDRGQPYDRLDYEPGRVQRVQTGCHAREDTTHQQTGERTHGRDAQLGTRRRGLAVQTGGAAQHPQGDPVDLNAIAASDHGVCQLVRQQRGQEDDRRQQRQSPVQQDGTAGVGGWELTVCESDGHQGDDDQDAPVQADPHAGDPAEGQRLIHEARLALELRAEQSPCPLSRPDAGL